MVSPQMSMRRLSACEAVLLMLLVWMPALGQTPTNKGEGAGKKEHGETRRRW